jgi:hypothetical protein
MEDEMLHLTEITSLLPKEDKTDIVHKSNNSGSLKVGTVLHGYFLGFEDFPKVGERGLIKAPLFPRTCSHPEGVHILKDIKAR